MMIGRRSRLVETPDLRDMLEEIHTSRENGFLFHRKFSSVAMPLRPKECTETEGDSLTDPDPAEAEPLANQELQEGQWQPVTFTTSGRLIEQPQHYT